jgi:hypothetical protein
LSRWICAFEIKFKKAHGEKCSAHAVSAEQWKATKMPNLLQEFCVDDIYNADKTGLLYCAMPDGSLSYKHTTLITFKDSNGSCNCIVPFKHVRKRKTEAVGCYEKG